MGTDWFKTVFVKQLVITNCLTCHTNFLETEIKKSNFKNNFFVSLQNLSMDQASGCTLANWVQPLKMLKTEFVEEWL